MSEKQVKSLWYSLRQRCNPDKPSGYTTSTGERAVMNSKWREDFLQFYADIGEPPAPGYRLTRINKALGFIPGNVMWKPRVNPPKPKTKKVVKAQPRPEGFRFNWAGWHMLYYKPGKNYE